jgi:hypothetical protein
VRIISIANDDVTYQDGGDSYVRGYSSGAQKGIIVCLHQVAISTADKFNGADLGIREE